MKDYDGPEVPDRAKEYFAPYLPTSELTPADVPAAGGPLDAIISFAYTLNGYWVAGRFGGVRISPRRRIGTRWRS